MIGFFWEEEGISSEELLSGGPRDPLASTRAKLALCLVREWGIGKTEAAC